MKKSMFALAAAAVLSTLPVASYADDMFAFNVGAVSDYRYRGISQSRLKPALQGGVDATLPGGFYVGTWASTIKWIEDTGTVLGFDAGNANVEIDLYGGYKQEIVKDLSFDVGVLQYWYPKNKLGDAPLGAFKNANTTELYGALTYGPATLKYSHALSNTFGNPDSKNSYYLDLSATFEGPWGLTFTPHVGRQKIKGPYDPVATYTDYSVSVAKEVVKGLTVSLSAVGTDADDTWYVTPAGKFTGKKAAVLGVKYAF
ncbi:TorF family putative porin [Ideonella sp. BN130291]|uniref:TorF family putative porin n=1 Tax=Ideonella sp. BN130291 TaxID=3112940 RepID=UPI002E25A80D|nr:TorF family putative porin [Ideonella sp. BN130291]